MKVVFFDLDNTLFDAPEFKKFLAVFFGLSVKEFDQYYNQYKAEYGNFKPDKLLSDAGLSQTDLEQILKTNINRFLLPGAKKILQIFKQKFDLVILVSLGDESFQNLKISHLKVGDVPFDQFFDEVIVVEKNKTENERIQKYKGNELVFINDKPAENLAFEAVFSPGATSYLMSGPYSHDPGLKTYKDLTQLESVLFPEEYVNGLTN